MKYDELERRYLKSAIEARGKDGDASVIVGHASVFDTPYELWGFMEQVARGAFKKTIKEGDVRALWNHDPNVVLGRNKSGTLRLSEDDVGLLYEIDLPDTQAAGDLYTLIERGDVNQSSFAFEVIRDEWQYPEGNSRELPVRTIKEARLWDVSPVTYPASDSTDVDVARALRSLTRDLGIDEAESIEDALTIARNKTAEATTETPDGASPEAPAATSPSEQKRTRPYAL